VRAVCVAGARPNFMKVTPVLGALERSGAETVLVHTGQHYDTSMSGVFFRDLGTRPPDHHLEVGSGTHAEQAGRVMTAFEPLVDALAPDVVVVVGDVNSTMACAIVAAKAGALVAHVEAGLRSRDWAMPEEVNRVVTDRVSDYLLAPSPDAVDNLQELPAAANLRLVEPLGYLDFIDLEAGARLVLTDSGGVQEETTVLGVPCLTLRENTERPITVTEGTNRVVGRDPAAIVAAARHVLEHGVEPRRPSLWDGKAGERIADVLLAPPTGRRPTDLPAPPA